MRGMWSTAANHIWVTCALLPMYPVLLHSFYARPQENMFVFGQCSHFTHINFLDSMDVEAYTDAEPPSTAHCAPLTMYSDAC